MLAFAPARTRSSRSHLGDYRDRVVIGAYNVPASVRCQATSTRLTIFALSARDLEIDRQRVNIAFAAHSLEMEGRRRALARGARRDSFPRRTMRSCRRHGTREHARLDAGNWAKT